MNWNFNAEEGKEGMNDFPVIPVGDHRIRFAKIEEVKSKTGKDMLKIEFDVSGYASKIFYYFVFDDSTPEARKRTNGNLMKIFDSFGIEVGNMNFQSWIGKVGACRIKHEIYDGRTNAKISYFKLKKDQIYMSEWVEKSNSNSGQTMQTVDFNPDDLQF